MTRGFVEASYIINTSCILSMSFTAVISGPIIVGRGGNPNSARKLLQTEVSCADTSCTKSTSNNCSTYLWHC